MPAKVSLFHNPRCSKSRAALALLQQRGLDVQIIDYLNKPPAAAELKQILATLEIPARDLLRKGEKLYRELNLNDPDMQEDALIATMVEHPILIERPIVITQTGAAIGRPIDNVIELLDGDD